ncbi:MAG: hypothetical protein WDN49_06715 [Acetobacteraceae bacterium]
MMVRIADMLARWPHASGDGIGILSGSGGGNGVMVDRVTEAGLRLASLSAASRAALGKLLLPPQADNPVDLGGRLNNDGEIADYRDDDPRRRSRCRGDQSCISPRCRVSSCARA